jgi:PAS domain S-box-containing protein
MHKEEREMYHCHTRFFLAGNLCRTFEMIKEMPPLEHFAHEFFEDGRPECEYISKADVIVANLQDADVKKMMQELAEHKREETEAIILAGKDQIPFLAEYLGAVEDIWTIPMSDEEIRFRFLKWQENCKTRKDFWETSQYLESTINYVPNLVWYKDKNGIHEKVNDSFCKTVNKTKEQVQGRGHAYIWNVEHDDPACIESEREVMSSEKTCVSEEVVQAGEGTRLLTTYKSPCTT